MALHTIDRLGLASLVTFVVGLLVGVVVANVVRPIGTRAYRTRIPLALQDARGRPIGNLPANALVVSKSALSNGENGWSAFVPLSLGDGTDAVELLVSAGRAPASIPLTDMLMIDRKSTVPSPGKAAHPAPPRR
jgi:hypothetical protein